MILNFVGMHSLGLPKSTDRLVELCLRLR
jgi:hypothetical protein